MTADLTVTEVERGPYSVDGEDVPAVHVRMVLELSGSSEGSSTMQIWSDAGTGMLLSVERETDTMVDTQLGRRRYRESLSMQLLTLRPRT